MFRPDAAQGSTTDACSGSTKTRRCIWTTTGRMRGLAYTGLPAHLELLANNRRGESDLIRRGRNWFLKATIDLPDVAAADPAGGFVGVTWGSRTSPSPTTRSPASVRTGPAAPSPPAGTRTGCCGPGCRKRALNRRNGC